MSTTPVRVERRAAQRFDVYLPVSIRCADAQKEEQGFTQDLSARGVYFYTDVCLDQGSEVEITLVMPVEITLSESMPICCHGKVLRVDKPGLSSAAGNPPKMGVAVHFGHYEYLPDAKDSSKSSEQYLRVASLHHGSVEEELPTFPAGLRKIGRAHV